MIDKKKLCEVENRLWISIRDNFNYAYDNGEIKISHKLDLLNNAYELKKYLGVDEVVDREYKEYQIYVKFLTEEDLSDNVRITEKFSNFYKTGCPGFLSIEIFRDD